MKILLVGDIFGNLDEGMKNTTAYLHRELSKRHEVLVMKPRRAVLPSNISRLIRFKPDVIHYIHGSSIRSFVVTQFCSMLCQASKSAISMMHPDLSGLTECIARIFAPDLLLVQSSSTKKRFSKMGVPIHLVPNGVDLDKFRPVSSERKRALRRKYNIANDAFIVLHIGSIRRTRNLETLIYLKQRLAVEVVIAGSTTIKQEDIVLKRLRENGCLVLQKYFSKIEELYGLSDCYLFPVKDPYGSVELPLTVLEAMACNIPVVSTDFGGLCEILEEGDGLFYADDEEDMISAIERIKKQDIKIATRNKVKALAWENVVEKLEQIYLELLQEKGIGENH